MKVVFLDRDGVINQERGDYTWRLEDWQFTDEIIPFLKETQKRGYKTIVITNQGGIAKGLYTHEDVQRLHGHMIQLLTEEGIEMLDIYYSPYHDVVSRSLSRKPDSLMLEKAIYLNGVDVKNSFMIGDSDRDIVAANRAGLKAFKVDPNGPLLHLLSSI